MIPEKIGRYEIKGVFGEGGMATVYRAYDPLFEREVALKMLHDRSLRGKDNRARFLREGRTVAKLDHPYIVPVYDIGEEDDKPYLVMRFMAGGSLSNVIRREPMSLAHIANVIERIGSALDEAHVQGIIHRDLKPANILLDQRGDAFLSDFGIVKNLEADSKLTNTGTLLGTLAYMSPEQLQGKTLDGRSDIYSLGVVLFQMVTGQLPFQGTSDYEIMMAHIQQSVPTITDTRADLPFTCQAIINKAMEKKPENRYATAAEMAQELKVVLSNYTMRQGTITATQTIEFPADAPKAPPLIPAEPAQEHLSTAERIKKLPVWAKLGIVLVGLFLLFGILSQVISALNTQRSAAETPTVEAVGQPLEIPVTTAVTENIIVRDWNDSAIWQVGEEMARIPEDGKLPLKNEIILIQSNAAPMELLLPDRTRLVLDTNTSINLNVIEDGLETAVIILQGRLGIEPVGDPVPVGSPIGIQAQTSQGLMGITFDAEQAVYTVDCLQDVCELSIAGESPISLNEGERRQVTHDGVSEAAAAEFDPYLQLFNRLPAPTAIAVVAIATDAATPVNTDTPLPTNNFGAESERFEFGQSVLGEPLEMVRFGDGSRHIVVVGGTHSGYAPNTVKLAEEFIDYYTENETAVPADVTLTIIPNLNPDASQSPSELAGRLNANGVDLNRNWDCRWAENPIVLGETQTGAGGTAIESEPEVQALADFFRQQTITAVIQLAAHGREYGIASPGSCLERSRVSVSLSKLYGKEANYIFPDSDDDGLVEPNENLTGDMTNWLDSFDVPAISVLLPRYETTDIELNLKGLTAVLEKYTGPETPVD